MAPASSIQTRNAARNAIVQAVTFEITDTKYTSNTMIRWRESVHVAAKNVPTKIGGAMGAHGHTYHTETDREFNKRAGTDPIPTTNPGALMHPIGIAVDLCQTTMAQEREDNTSALGAFHTQEGVTISLRKVIIASVPT